MAQQLSLGTAARPLKTMREQVAERLADFTLRQSQRDAKRRRRRAVGETEARERRRKRARRAVEDQGSLF